MLHCVNNLPSRPSTAVPMILPTVKLLLLIHLTFQHCILKHIQFSTEFEESLLDCVLYFFFTKIHYKIKITVRVVLLFALWWQTVLVFFFNFQINLSHICSSGRKQLFIKILFPHEISFSCTFYVKRFSVVMHFFPFLLPFDMRKYYQTFAILNT